MTDEAPKPVKLREKREKPLPALIPQPHGGALYRGGVPGNRGGWKPPSAIRARLRGSLDDRVAILEEIADDPAMAASDRIRAVDLQARYGLGASCAMRDRGVESELGLPEKRMATPRKL